MSKKILWVLTVFLSLAMIALILVQTSWIRNSVQLKEKQFSLLVNQVLTDIQNDLTQKETVTQILDEINRPDPLSSQQTFWSFELSATTIIDDESHREHRLENQVITPKPEIIEENFRKIEQLDDSILYILRSQVEDPHSTVISVYPRKKIKKELERTLEDEEVFVDRILKKMMHEEKSVEELITHKELQSILSKKLMEKGIDLDFEYAVHENEDSIVYKSEKYEGNSHNNYYKASLFPQDLFGSSAYISLFFPKSKDYLVRSLGYMFGISIGLTLSILILVSLALYVIYRQKRLSEMKNDFVNNMTHELKTPISTISLASQMLSDASIPLEQKNLGHISKIIDKESKQLGYQVERVLQMAIFDQGQLKLKQKELNVHDLIETVAQNFIIQIDKRRGKLHYNPEAEEATIIGDDIHITNVISNLLENAVKYTPGKPEIEISTLNRNHELILTVKDNGIGISKEHQKRIFDKFYRVPTGNIHNVKGFGLGLSYVKLIIESHQGHIELKSEPNQGTQFDIHLPLNNQGKES